MDASDISGMHLRLPDGREFGTLGMCTFDPIAGFTAAIYQPASQPAQLSIEPGAFREISAGVITPTQLTARISQLVAKIYVDGVILDSVQLGIPPGPDTGPIGNPKDYPPGVQPPPSPPPKNPR